MASAHVTITPADQAVVETAKSLEDTLHPAHEVGLKMLLAGESLSVPWAAPAKVGRWCCFWR